MTIQSFARLVLIGFVAFFVLALFGIGLTGCATTAGEQQASNLAEGTFLVLDTVDMLQDVQRSKAPCCAYPEPAPWQAIDGGTHPKEGSVVLVHAGFMFLHTVVTSWLDDQVAAREVGDADGQLKYWYGARVIWHTLSLGFEGYEIGHNYADGVTPFKVP